MSVGHVDWGVGEALADKVLDVLTDEVTDCPLFAGGVATVLVEVVEVVEIVEVDRVVVEIIKLLVEAFKLIVEVVELLSAVHLKVPGFKLMVSQPVVFFNAWLKML